MSVLIVVSHPDDEVLGCGATAAALTKKNIEVRACILSGKADARRNRPTDRNLSKDILKAQKILKMPAPIMGHFRSIRLNTFPHIELVRFIEKAIEETKADVIFTHHPGDLNNDHVHTSLCCQTAARLFQRKTGIPQLKALYFMEILSSTDWAFSGGIPFVPDTFFPIKDTLDLKISALKAYQGVLRDFPHSRSIEIIKSLAAVRGAQAGIEYAEAFQTGFQNL